MSIPIDKLYQRFSVNFKWDAKFVVRKGKQLTNSINHYGS